MKSTFTTTKSFTEPVYVGAWHWGDTYAMTTARPSLWHRFWMGLFFGIKWKPITN